MCEPDLVSSSAFSFPSKSKCPGHHVRAIYRSLCLSSRSNMFFRNSSELDWAFPGATIIGQCQQPHVAVRTLGLGTGETSGTSIPMDFSLCNFSILPSLLDGTNYMLCCACQVIIMPSFQVFRIHTPIIH